jgi:hypothetical protein
MSREGKHNFYRLLPQRAVELRATMGQFLKHAETRPSWAEFFTGSRDSDWVVDSAGPPAEKLGIKPPSR